ncbi:PLC-like phosphodiesterase [Aspergillus venezuelensis]
MATVDKITKRTGQVAINPSSQSPATKPIGAFSPSFQTHLDQIYKSLTASAHSNFIKDVQRDANDAGGAEPDPLSSLAAFHNYMASPSAAALRHATKPDDSAPITDYFISSSHNTYLTGNQLYSDAAAAAYSDALLSGCRCVEIDPRVLHGHTLTKGTTFREVCYAIRDSAFVVSDLPVIVSLEVHASFEQQETMVEIMEDAFKGLLIEVTPEIEAMETVPPLKELRNKILVKVKWVPPTAEGQEEEEDKTDDLEQLESTNSAQSASQPPQKPAKILPSLSKHAVFTKGFSFKQFSQPEAKVPGHVFSLSERAARQADEKYGKALFEHNRKYFMRVYPYGLRVNSSNLDPTFFWRRGAQIVALNWQNCDKGMMLNQGMFAGEDGWIIKPQGYRSTEPEDAPIPRHSVDLSIEILAGQDLALPPGDKNEKGFKPYVSCYLHVETPEDAPNPKGDDSTDSEKTSYRREIKSGQGCNPDFGAQKLQFPNLTGVVEELTFVRFKVKDDEIGLDSLASWACIRLTRLQEGYRIIRLYKCDGSDSGGFLLVRISKTIS